MASHPRASVHTYHWRLVRASLALALPLPCPFCGGMIQPSDAFDLDHSVPRVFGGDGSAVRLAHAKCNRSAGSQLRRARTVHTRAW